MRALERRHARGLTSPSHPFALRRRPSTNSLTGPKFRPVKTGPNPVWAGRHRSANRVQTGFIFGPVTELGCRSRTGPGPVPDRSLLLLNLIPWRPRGMLGCYRIFSWSTRQNGPCASARRACVAEPSVCLRPQQRRSTRMHRARRLRVDIGQYSGAHGRLRVSRAAPHTPAVMRPLWDLTRAARWRGAAVFTYPLKTRSALWPTAPRLGACGVAHAACGSTHARCNAPLASRFELWPVWRGGGAQRFWPCHANSQRPLAHSAALGRLRGCAHGMRVHTRPLQRAFGVPLCPMQRGEGHWGWACVAALKKVTAHVWRLTREHPARGGAGGDKRATRAYQAGAWAQQAGARARQPRGEADFGGASRGRRCSVRQPWHYGPSANIYT